MRMKIISGIPHLFTFGTLIAGMASIVLSIDGYLTWAAILILVGLVTDSLDGFIARATRTGSDFGVQLDSLADTVCFGVASTIFIYQFISLYDAPPFARWLITLPIPIAGVFRLARFNQQPVKTGEEKNTKGLTITASGVIIALAGLSAIHYKLGQIPLWVIVGVSLSLAFLMASQIRFPTVGYLVKKKRVAAVILALGTVLSVRFSPQIVSFSIMLSYVGFGLARAGIGLTHRQ
ncbi:MAG: CDP-alcohol phosphatidyltransferase family protein [Anaerolineales bacterium]|nr:CDP-alcohol phosphatidyltransferase family protein [Anaerolineales bacterium]